MTTTIAALKGIMALGGKVVLPSLLPIMMFADGIIDEKTVLPLTVVIGVSAAAWYVSDFVRGIKDERKASNLRMDAFERTLLAIKKMMEDSEARHKSGCPLPPDILDRIHALKKRDSTAEEIWGFKAKTHHDND